MKNFISDPLGIINYLFDYNDRLAAFKWILHSKDYDIYRIFYRELYPKKLFPFCDADKRTVLAKKTEFCNYCHDTIEILLELEIENPITVLLVSDLFLKPTAKLKECINKHGSIDVSWVINTLMEYHDSAMLELTKILYYDNIIDGIRNYSDPVFFELIDEE